MRRMWLVVAVAAFTAGCALRLGGPAPENRRTVAMKIGAGLSADSAAARIRALDGDAVLISTPADSAWLARAAYVAGYSVSTSTRGGNGSFAFLTRTAALGDSTVALAVEGADSLVVHDALYQVDDDRYFDLLAFRIGSSAPVQATIRALLLYIATDVSGNAAVAILVDAADAATADSVAALLSPAFTDARACVDDDDAKVQRTPLRLFYGPQTHTECKNARVVGADVIDAQLVIGR